MRPDLQTPNADAVARIARSIRLLNTSVVEAYDLVEITLHEVEGTGQSEAIHAVGEAKDALWKARMALEGAVSCDA